MSQVFTKDIVIQPNDPDQNFAILAVPAGTILKLKGASINLDHLTVSALPSGPDGFTDGVSLGYLLIGQDPSQAMCFRTMRMFKAQHDDGLPWPIVMNSFKIMAYGADVAPEGSLLWLHLGTQNFGADQIPATVTLVFDAE